jgi:hypothetical protein
VAKEKFVRRDRPQILPLLVLFISFGVLVCPVNAQTEAIEDGVRAIQLTISTQPQQTFEDLVQQARTLAQSLVEQGFAESADATEVAVQILGERDGQEVPLLMARVSRSNWQTQPDIDVWARYFAIPARVLLGFAPPPTQQSLESVVRVSPLSRGRSYRRGRGRG